MPDSPRRPDSRLIIVLIRSGASPRSMRKNIISGSKEPLRVPMGSPSSGVNPIEVSTLFPLLHGADALAVSQVAGDDLQAPDVAAEQLRGAVRRVLVAGSVEPVFP